MHYLYNLFIFVDNQQMAQRFHRTAYNKAYIEHQITFIINKKN